MFKKKKTYFLSFGLINHIPPKLIQRTRHFENIELGTPPKCECHLISLVSLSIEMVPQYNYMKGTLRKQFILITL